jgi:hypothetical protein
MAEKKTPETKPFKVKSAFVWDKKIRKPSDKEPLMLTTAEAAPLLHRGKIELGKPAAKASGATKPAATKPAATTPAATKA